MAFLQSITKFVLDRKEKKLRKAAEVTRLYDNQSVRIEEEPGGCKGHNYMLTCQLLVHIVYTLLLKILL